MTITAKNGTISSIIPRVGMVTVDLMDVEFLAPDNEIVNLRGK